MHVSLSSILSRKRARKQTHRYANFSSLCKLMQGFEQTCHIRCAMCGRQGDAQARRALGHGGRTNRRDPDAAFTQSGTQIQRRVIAANQQGLYRRCRWHHRPRQAAQPAAQLRDQALQMVAQFITICYQSQKMCIRDSIGIRPGDKKIHFSLNEV